MKTKNILVDVNYSVKVADFGLSRLFPLDLSHISTTHPDKQFKAAQKSRRIGIQSSAKISLDRNPKRNQPPCMKFPFYFMKKILDLEIVFIFMKTFRSNSFNFVRNTSLKSLRSSLSVFRILILFFYKKFLI